MPRSKSRRVHLRQKRLHDNNNTMKKLGYLCLYQIFLGQWLFHGIFKTAYSFSLSAMFHDPGVCLYSIEGNSFFWIENEKLEDVPNVSGTTQGQKSIKKKKRKKKGGGGNQPF